MNVASIKASLQSNPDLPKHVAIIMDGNGRWAVKRKHSRVFGHRAGVNVVRQVVACAVDLNLQALTLFAFSSENWSRPKHEVTFLMNLFHRTLEQALLKLKKNNIRFKTIGDITSFHPNLQALILRAEQLTKDCTGLSLRLAVNYGGRWDITQAVQQIVGKLENNKINSREVNQQLIAEHLSLADLPDPDLLIRTSGEQRISNFMLWQLAYTEFAFTEAMWPDFSEQEFLQLLMSYIGRERRFGGSGETYHCA